MALAKIHTLILSTLLSYTFQLAVISQPSWVYIICQISVHSIILSTLMIRIQQTLHNSLFYKSSRYAKPLVFAGCLEVDFKITQFNCS